MANTTREDIVEDPAESHPWKRYILRNFITKSLIYLAIIIPASVFFLVSILLNFSIKIGIILAACSFFGYIYFLWKKELWNKIMR